MSAAGATLCLPVAEDSQIGGARRRIAALAAGTGLDETGIGRVSIVATELATNILLHGRGGHLLVRRLPGGIEMVAIDRGPGIRDVQESLRDGVSTAGTAGNGLGAIRRLSDVFDLHTQPGLGTAVLAQVVAEAERSPSRLPRVGAVCVAVAGEQACGDAWSAVAGERLCRIALVDGLGHGLEAARAADLALATLATVPHLAPAPAIEACHRAIAATRGAAMAICDLDLETRVVRFAGVGNVCGAIVRGGDSRSMVSHNGIVGHQLRKAQEFAYPWFPDAMLVMHSDGLHSRWTLPPGAATRHPALIAALLFRDSARGRDDASAIVLKEP